MKVVQIFYTNYDGIMVSFVLNVVYPPHRGIKHTNDLFVLIVAIKLL